MAASKPALDLERARSPENLLFECVAGSRAYGTSTPDSDIDLRGIFAAPQNLLYRDLAPPQVSDANNDETYYEIGRFVELLSKNNPNLVELLFAPTDTIRSRNPVLDLIRPEMVLSKLCEQTFAGYAVSQIKKARGLKKKIVNPVDEQRKSPIDFCFVVEGQGSTPLQNWLDQRDLVPERCGLIKVPHMRDVHAIFYDAEGEIGQHGYRGIFSNEDATELRLSSIPKGQSPIGWMQYNIDAFTRHCRQHQEYWAWVNNRNSARYDTNIEHGKNYDSKNMMRIVRLLSMAEEIAREGIVHVRRPDADLLLRIRAGELDYEELIALAEDKIASIGEAFAQSDLPAEPDEVGLRDALVEIRMRHYAG